MPTTQGQENRKRAHGTNAQWLKSTERKHKFGDEKKSELDETHDRSVSYRDRSRLRWWREEITIDMRWEWNVGGQEAKWTEVRGKTGRS